MFCPVRPLRHLQRYGELAAIFARHGFGSLFQSRGWLQSARRKPPAAARMENRAVHFRLALEEAGPTFVKLGQILSTRPDLLPMPFIAELAKLVDSVAPQPWETMREVLKRELGREPEEAFAFIDPRPMASASLSQVHAAKLRDGREVVVKIQRPNILAAIETDLEILASLAAAAQASSLGKLYDFVAVADDFSFTLRNELDYQREGRNADRLRASFADESGIVYVPKVYWELSSRQVLTLERIYGVKINDIAGLDGAGYDRHKIALHSAQAIVKQAFEDGFFHADPHSGNYIIMPGEVIGLVDFGKVGYLREKDRMDLIRLYIVGVEMDVDGFIDQLLRMGAVREDLDRNRLAYDLNRFLNKYYGVPIKYIRAQELIDEVAAVVFRHHLRLPSSWWLVIQTVVMLEGIGLQLDPDFDVFKAAEPHIRRLMKTLFLPGEHWIRNVLLDGANWGDLLHRLPRVGARMLERLERNESIRVEVGDMERILSRLDRLATRLSLSLLVAAFVVAFPILLPMTLPGSLPRWLLFAASVPVAVAAIWLGFLLLYTPKK